MKIKLFIVFICLVSFLSLGANVLAVNKKIGRAPEKLKGKILLQTESKGEAWYINPSNSERYSMGKPEDFFGLISEIGTGISNENLKKIEIAKENLFGFDSDKDGLSDIFELSIGTSINKIDSDGDGFDDKSEVINNYNPSGAGKIEIDKYFSKQLSGKILIQTQGKGEAWYVNPSDHKRYFLGRPIDAFYVMRKLGLGISNADLLKITENESSHNYSKAIVFPDEVGYYKLRNLKSVIKCEKICAKFSTAEYVSSKDVVVVVIIKLAVKNNKNLLDKANQEFVKKISSADGVVIGQYPKGGFEVDWRNSDKVFIRIHHEEIPYKITISEKYMKEFRETNIQPLELALRDRGWKDLSRENEIVRYFLKKYPSIDIKR